MNLVAKYKAKNLTRIDIEGASDSELLDLKVAIDADIARVSGQITEAKAKAEAHSAYSDPVWFRRVTMAKRIKGGFSQMIQNELGKRRRARAEANREANTEIKIQQLLKAMDIVLKPEVKLSVVSKAEELLGFKLH